MRRRILPSLSALRTFEAVARRESFTLAAAELNVTQSAASRQVRALEAYLDLSLFKRTSRRSELTSGGRYYFNSVRESLDRIEAGTTELIATCKGGGTLSIGVLPTFGTRWLIPRLHLFRGRHPEILINVISTDGQFAADMPKFDLAIQFGSGSWPDAIAEPLMAEEIVVACSPQLLREISPLDRLSDLSQYPLLQHTTRSQAWGHWFRSVGFMEQDARWGPSFEHFFMLIQAAQSGLGVALLPRVLIENELARKELVVPLAYRVAGPGAYYLESIARHGAGKAVSPLVTRRGSPSACGRRCVAANHEWPWRRFTHGSRAHHVVRLRLRSRQAQSRKSAIPAAIPSTEHSRSTESHC